MAKCIDITDKLNFEESPKLKIKGTDINVNSDAATMLKIMGVLGDNKAPGPQEVVQMYELIFDKKEREKIEKLKLNFVDFQVVVFTAISLITGESEEKEQ